MIPIRDANPTRSFTVVTVALIAINLAVFLFEMGMASARQLQTLTMNFGVVPARITQDFGLLASVSLLTSMFLHSGPVHLIGNMLYLWIFGNNVEDNMGSGRFVIFYLLCGLSATVAQIAINPMSTTPMIGASGAIAGVLGAYIVLFPRARVDTIVPLGFFIQVVQLPAIVVLGFWIVIQFFSGAASLAIPQGAGTVAWFAHIGGFVAGLVLINVFRRRRRRPW